MPTRTRRTAALLGGLLLAAGALAACGDDDDVDTATGDVPEESLDEGAASDPAAGACLEGTTDCVDTPMDPDESVSSPADGGMDPADGDADFPSDEARQRAQELLGTAESELEIGADLRIGRRGDEQFMLTEDYVLGRITVELDDDGSGSYVVTQATVELPEGPETCTLDQD
ncbi:MAG: hypothetical protein ACLGIC_14395 [Acidimicrobiia bacterium]